MGIDLETLRRHPLGREMKDALLAALQPIAEVVRFEAGQRIFRRGEPADALYLVVGGRATLEQHVPGRGTLQLETLGSGDVLGLSWLYPGATWTLDARAVEPVETIRLPAAALRERMGTNPGLALAISTFLNARLYDRLQRVRLQRLDVYRAEP